MSADELSSSAASNTVRRRRSWIATRSGDESSRRRGLIGPGSPDSSETVESPRAGRTRASLLLHHLGEASSHANAGLGISIVLAGWVLAGALTGFPAWWQEVLECVGTVITLVMVFAIQHTQSRQQSATQRKLDELLRAMPAADNRLIAVEEAPDAELQALADLNLADREDAS